MSVLKCLDVGGGRNIPGKGATPRSNENVLWTSINVLGTEGPDYLCSIESTPFDDNSFNYIRFKCIPYWVLKPRVFKETNRILAQNGVVYISTGPGAPFDSIRKNLQEHFLVREKMSNSKFRPHPIFSCLSLKKNTDSL